MEGLLSWIATACGALFVVAVAVAWWEHLARARKPPVEQAPDAARVVSVDVHLDTLTAAPAGDSAERRATLDGAIGRMAQAGAPDRPDRRPRWVDTRPMVQGGQRAGMPSDTAASPLA